MGGLFGQPEIEETPQAPSVADQASQLAAEQVRKKARLNKGRDATVLAPATDTASVLAPPSVNLGGK